MITKNITYSLRHGLILNIRDKMHRLIMFNHSRKLYTNISTVRLYLVFITVMGMFHMVPNKGSNYKNNDGHVTTIFNPVCL